MIHKRTTLSLLRSLITGLGLSVVLACTSAVAEESDTTVTEYRIKSAFLYNFSRFVTWPEGAIPDNGDFNVCVLGSDPFGKILDSLSGKKVDSNKLTIRRSATLDDTGNCQLVYVNIPSSKLAGTMAELSKRPVLTVSDMDGFTDAGGIIKFKLVDKKVRFDINIDAARESGLSISSKLLSLATIVRGGSR